MRSWWTPTFTAATTQSRSSSRRSTSRALRPPHCSRPPARPAPCGGVRCCHVCVSVRARSMSSSRASRLMARLLDASPTSRCPSSLTAVSCACVRLGRRPSRCPAGTSDRSSLAAPERRRQGACAPSVRHHTTHLAFAAHEIRLRMWQMLPCRDGVRLAEGSEFHTTCWSAWRLPREPALLEAGFDAVGLLALLERGAWPAAFSSRSARLTLLAPRVLSLHLLFLLRREVVCDVEPHPYLLGRLSLDLVGDGFAREVEERLDVEVVRGEDQVEEGLVVHLHKVLLPVCLLLLWDTRRLRAVVVLAVLDHLGQDPRVDHRKRHGRVRASVLNHIFDRDRAARHLALNLEQFLLLALQLDKRRLLLVVSHLLGGSCARERLAS
mmetsp:Transcript_279/g.923  ORF Transcript_279/g.923 Transcript_279/m.923 type:complete len:381 (+) Transcript_279:921-2063(+)